MTCYLSPGRSSEWTGCIDPIQWPKAAAPKNVSNQRSLTFSRPSWCISVPTVCYLCSTQSEIVLLHVIQARCLQALVCFVLQEAVRGPVGGLVPPGFFARGLLPLPSLCGCGGWWDTRSGCALRPLQHKGPNEHDGRFSLMIAPCRSSCSAQRGGSVIQPGLDGLNTVLVVSIMKYSSAAQWNWILFFFTMILHWLTIFDFCLDKTGDLYVSPWELIVDISDYFSWQNKGLINTENSNENKCMQP